MDDERCRRYNSHDLRQQARLLGALDDDLARNGQREFYRRWHDEIVPVAMAMQRRGFGEVDWDAHRRVSAELGAELEEVERGVLARCGLFAQMLAAAEARRTADEASDWAAVRAKNAARKRPQPDEELKPTRAVARERTYQSALRAIDRKRASFFNHSNALRGMLFEELGIPPAPASKRLGRGERSLRADAIIYMLEKLPAEAVVQREVLMDLAHIFRLRKIQQGYLQPLRDNPDFVRDGRLRPTIRLYGIETLRWSYVRPSLHNWPPRMQPIVRAASGHSFISVDYKQIEAGIMAILCDDEAELREWLRPGGDLHRLMAMDALGLSLEQWEALSPDARKGRRDVFKGCRYERMYGGEGTKARGKMGCPCRRCRQEAGGATTAWTLSAPELRRAMERWAACHPGMVAFRDTILREVRRGGNAWVSPFGYRRVSCQPVAEAKRSWWNFPFQHCVAMIINRAARRLHDMGCPLVFQHHDSLISEPRETEVELWTARMVECMSAPVPELRGVRFPVDVKVGKTWKEVK